MATTFSFDLKAEYDTLHSRFPNHKEAPLIGITGNFSDGIPAAAVRRRTFYVSAQPFEPDERYPAWQKRNGTVSAINRRE